MNVFFGQMKKRMSEFFLKVLYHCTNQFFSCRFKDGVKKYGEGNWAVILEISRKNPLTKVVITINKYKHIFLLWFSFALNAQVLT
jgi:hypothetical protein